jgi:hypothetical protein
MSWFRVDTGYFANRKIGRLTHRQMCLDIAAIGRSHADLTNGFLSPSALGHVLIDSRAKQSDVRALVEHGRWEIVASGWQLHDFLKHNQAAETIAARRDAHTAEMNAWRKRRQDGGA